MGSMKTLAGIVCGLICLAGPAPAADYAHMMAMSATRLQDMTAGPGGTAALISADGSRILHIGISQICVLDRSDNGSWERTSCEETSAKTTPRGPEDMWWSPDGAHLLMPNYAEAFMYFRDTDVRLFDPNTFAVTNLTDDRIEDGLIAGFPGTAHFDVSPRWVDDDTIAFLRYVIPGGGIAERGGALLMTLDRAGGEPVQVAKQLAPDGVIIYTLAVTREGQRFAYTIDPRDGVKTDGLYVLDLGGAPRRVLKGSEVGQPPTGIAFSADGNYLLLLSPRERDLDTRVLDIESGVVVPVGDGMPVTGVAWSPTDAALAYIVDDGDGPDHRGGLYLSPAPGEPGEMLVRGRFMPPVCCGRQPFIWAGNNTILLGRIEDMQTTLEVILGP